MFSIWNIAGAQISLQPAFWGFLEIFGMYLRYCLMCVKIFHFKCVYIGQPVFKISEFLNAFIRKCTVKTIVSYNASVNSQK